MTSAKFPELGLPWSISSNLHDLLREVSGSTVTTGDSCYIRPWFADQVRSELQRCNEKMQGRNNPQKECVNHNDKRARDNYYSISVETTHQARLHKIHNIVLAALLLTAFLFTLLYKTTMSNVIVPACEVILDQLSFKIYLQLMFD